MTSTVTETTFSTYNEEQAKAYSHIRVGYHPNVYKAVVDYHKSTNGQLQTLLDVGCGPGLATRSLAPHFTNVIGLDPSSGMIAIAHGLNLRSSTFQPARFEISTAETLGGELSPPIEDSSVDLITAANAAHWFDMPAFWRRAVRVLKPSGTVAIWTSGDVRIHPSTPNASAIQAAIDVFDETHMRPHYLPGNIHTRNRYRDLPLPWKLDTKIPEFAEEIFVRKEWELDEDFFVGLPEGNMDMFELSMGSQSAYVRWKEANAETAGTERDVLKVLRKEVERLLHEAGVEEGKELVKGAVYGVLLLLKKQA